MSEIKAGPRLIPLTVALGIILWLFVTTGWRQVFVKEVLGSAYDSQAEHFLRGDVGIDVDDIRHEAMIVNGKVYTYFGPFPAFLRIPLNFLYPHARGKWSRLSGFTAGMISLLAFAGLIRDRLRTASLRPWQRELIANVSLLGFAFASPLLLLLGNLSIYDEAVIWGFAASIAALFFAYRAWDAAESASPWMLLGFSVSASAALLSRVTFGLPLFLFAPVFLPKLWRHRRFAQLAALVLPILAGGLFYVLLGYARFGTPLGVDYNNYINPTHREFAHQHHTLDLSRVPASVIDYFGIRFPPTEDKAPFLRGERRPYHHPTLYSLDFSETYLSVFWGSSWLLFGAIIGLFFLFTRQGQTFERILAGACAIEAVVILSYYALAQRYSTDLFPLLIVCFLVFLRVNGNILRRTLYIVVALTLFSVVVNSLTTISWLIDSDMNVPPATRATWRTLLGRQP